MQALVERRERCPFGRLEWRVSFWGGPNWSSPRPQRNYAYRTRWPGLPRIPQASASSIYRLEPRPAGTVRSGALEAAVILLPEQDRLPAEVLGTPLGKERLVIVASRREGHSGLRKIEDLAGVQWILNPDGCAARATLRRLLLRANVDMVVAVESYNYELQLALVAQNRGLSLVPERILTRSPLRSRLRILRVPGLHFPLRIWTVQRELMELDQVIEKLSRILIERLRMPGRRA